MRETELMHRIMIALSARGYKVFRANVGKVRMADGRYFDTGLPKGFSDILCIQPETGRACFVECKIKPNRPTPEQLNFIKVMREQGALAGVAYSVEEALEIANERVQS